MIWGEKEDTWIANLVIRTLNQLSKIKNQRWRNTSTTLTPNIPRLIGKEARSVTACGLISFELRRIGCYKLIDVRSEPLCGPDRVYLPNFTYGKTEAPVGRRKLMEVSLTGCPMSPLL